jgi:hypothetical protein
MDIFRSKFVVSPLYFNLIKQIKGFYGRQTAVSPVSPVLILIT